MYLFTVQSHRLGKSRNMAVITSRRQNLLKPTLTPVGYSMFPPPIWLNTIRVDIWGHCLLQFLVCEKLLPFLPLLLFVSEVVPRMENRSVFFISSKILLTEGAEHTADAERWLGFSLETLNPIPVIACSELQVFPRPYCRLLLG